MEPPPLPNLFLWLLHKKKGGADPLAILGPSFWVPTIAFRDLSTAAVPRATRHSPPCPRQCQGLLQAAAGPQPRARGDPGGADHAGERPGRHHPPLPAGADAEVYCPVGPAEGVSPPRTAEPNGGVGMMCKCLKLSGTRFLGQRVKNLASLRPNVRPEPTRLVWIPLPSCWGFLVPWCALGGGMGIRQKSPENGSSCAFIIRTMNAHDSACMMQNTSCRGTLTLCPPNPRDRILWG